MLTEDEEETDYEKLIMNTPVIPKGIRKSTLWRYIKIKEIFMTDSMMYKFYKLLTEEEVQVLRNRCMIGTYKFFSFGHDDDYEPKCPTLDDVASTLGTNKSEILRIERSYLAKAVSFISEFKDAATKIDDLKKKNEQFKMDMVSAIQKIDAIMKSGVDQIQSVKEDILSELSPKQKQMFISIVSKPKQPEATH